MGERVQQWGPPSGAAHEPAIARKRVAGMLVAYVRCRDESAGCGALFERLRQEAGEHICGPPLCLHDAKSLEIECCYPVEQGVESAAIHCKRLPGGDALSLVHCGPCSQLCESWERLFDYIERNNLPVEGPWREIYLDGLVDEAGEQRIELQAPLMKSRAEGG
jgi:effector-binding domain-containing protein